MCEYSHIHIHTYIHTQPLYPIIPIYAVLRSLILLIMISSQFIIYVIFFSLCWSIISNLHLCSLELNLPAGSLEDCIFVFASARHLRLLPEIILR